MKVAVVVFPGSNCDRDLAVAFERAGAQVSMVWHKDWDLPEGVDLVGLPGGFSFGDYLRCGAIAARSPICQAVVNFAKSGGYVFGICNGFQVLTETGLLPGVLIRNSEVRFVCKNLKLEVATASSDYTSAYKPGQQIDIPIAHHDGNFRIDDEGLKVLQGDDRIAFRYLNNPNGSLYDIAGVLSENRRVLGMMPHPERAVDPVLGSADGSAMFTGLINGLVSA